MFSLIFLCFMLGQEQESFRLDNENLSVFKVHRSSVQSDGSFIMITATKTFHFDSEGRLLRRLGGRGDGPGEFQRIHGAILTGERYLVLDDRRIDVSIFDTNGTFLKRNPFKGYNFKKIGSKLFASSYKPLLEKDPTMNALCEIKFSENGDVEFGDQCFYLFRKEVFDFHMNFKKILLSNSRDLFYVLDEFRPEVTIYDTSYQRVGSLTLQIQGYVKPEKPWPRDTPVKQYLRNIRALSWIHLFEKTSKGFFVSLTSPDPNDPDGMLFSNQLLDNQGKNISLMPNIKGQVIGLHGDIVYSIEELEEFGYILHKYHLQQRSTTK